MGCNFMAKSFSFFEKNSFSSFEKKKDGMSLNPNPDSSRYKILKSWQVGKMLILFINYPDCINYEGNKVLVFENITIKNINAQFLIDPHFCDNSDFYSPIARFEPTERGIQWALNWCESLK